MSPKSPRKESLPRLRPWAAGSLLLFLSVRALHAADAAPVGVVAAPNPAPRPPVVVPIGVPGVLLNPAQAKSALSQYLLLRDQLIEERRLALVQATAAPDLASKQRILTALQIAQKDRLTQLRQFRAQVMEFNQGQRPSAVVKPAATNP